MKRKYLPSISDILLCVSFSMIFCSYCIFETWATFSASAMEITLTTCIGYFVSNNKNEKTFISNPSACLNRQDKKRVHKKAILERSTTLQHKKLQLSI